MPILTCRVCGRVVDTAESTEPLILEERRCPRCGSPLAEPGAAPPMPDEARSAAVAALPDRIAFLGFGLIGASIALALREAGYGGSLAAWTPSGRDPGEGTDAGSSTRRRRTRPRPFMARA